jgi:predicted acylesterase/phospholipase RssA
MNAPAPTHVRARVIEVLRASRVFGALEDVIINDLANALKLRTVRGGDVVVREGDVADSMLFVISGGLRISRRDAQGNLSLYNEVRPGASFGEVGLILQQPRAADVTALRDSILATLSRADFDALLVRHPLPLNKVFVQAIYNYLRHQDQVVERRHAESFVVVPLQVGADAGEVARNLTTAFSKIGRVHHLSPSSHGLGDQINVDTTDEVQRNDALEEQFDYLVYEAEPHASAWTRLAFRQADQVIFVVSSDALQTVGELERQLVQEPGFAMKRRHLVVLYPEGTHQPSDVMRWRGGRDLERVYPTRRKHLADYARLARFLTGTAVGIVLGGGGARGFAHLGVLKALHENGIAIDLIGGNSMGALIGAQYACDVPLDDIRERTRHFAMGGERPTLPLISLVSGKRVQRDLQKMFGETQMDGLWRPFFAAACNLSRGGTTAQDSGPLWRAVLASNSPAGLFPPVLHKGDLLVDGAILENVPVASMRVRMGTAQEKRRGNGTIIAVDVDVAEDLRVHPDLSHLSVGSTLKGLIMRKPDRTPSITDIIYRAGHIGGLNQRGRTIAQADHYLEPPVASYSMMGYRSAADISEVGYRYAMEKIGQWKR